MRGQPTISLRGVLSVCNADQVLEATPYTTSAGASTKPQNFLPPSAQKKLDERRNKFGPGTKSAEDMEKKSAEAVQRRQVRNRVGNEVSTKKLIIMSCKINTICWFDHNYDLTEFWGFVLQAELEARQEKMAELNKSLDNHKKKQELTLKQESKEEAALVKRLVQLFKKIITSLSIKYDLVLPFTNGIQVMI